MTALAVRMRNSAIELAVGIDATDGPRALADAAWWLAERLTRTIDAWRAGR